MAWIKIIHPETKHLKVYMKVIVTLNFTKTFELDVRGSPSDKDLVHQSLSIVDKLETKYKDLHLELEYVDGTIMIDGDANKMLEL